MISRFANRRMGKTSKALMKTNVKRKQPKVKRSGGHRALQNQWEINDFAICKSSHGKTFQSPYENKGETETTESDKIRRSKNLIKPMENHWFRDSHIVACENIPKPL